MRTEDGDVVGFVSRLWRYPVKSMLGEEIESADVVWSGFHGNRCYALVDQESSKLVSAKNPLKWARMFECSSKLVNEGRGPGSAKGTVPQARVVLPDGRHFDIGGGDYEAAERALSELLGREVRFTAARAEPGVFAYEQYHPEIAEDAQRGKTTEFVRPLSSQAGTFTDKAAVHLVTTASLRALAGLDPSATFDPLRFRPNVLVDTGMASGFIDTGWVGRNLTIGDEVEMKVFAECGRCVMTTLPQGDLSADVGVLRTVMKYNRGKTGVFASVLTGGKVRKGDRVILLP
jgi:MOSC domain-containing protein